MRGGTHFRCVKSCRLHPIARLVGVLALMVAWFIATNHCALGLMKPSVEARAEHSHCKACGEAPEKEGPKNAVRECCKSIVSAPLPAKAVVKYDAGKFGIETFVVPGRRAIVNAKEICREKLEHGPPRARSFAETVLQRSLLAHAPPCTV